MIQHAEEDGMYVVSSKISKGYAYLHSKICDSNTVIVENVKNDGTEVGVHVDVFPIDGLGTKEDAKYHFNKTRIERELLVASNWKKFFRSKTHAWYVEPVRFVFWIMSRFVSVPNLVNKVESYYAQFPLENSEFGVVICSSYREKEIMPVNILNSFCEVEFEGRNFMAFKNYNIYLKNIYGDYMKLPPKEKRVTHHMFKAYWKD